MGNFFHSLIFFFYFFSTMTEIIHEVTVTVPKDKNEGYENFLNDYVAKVLQIDGFTSGEIFRVDNDDEVEYCVQYRVASREHYNNYLKNKQEEVSKGGSEFDVKVKSRRTLVAKNKIHARSKASLTGMLI